MKNVIKKVIPRTVLEKSRPMRSKMSVIRNYISDYQKYIHQSAHLDTKKNKETHSSELIFYYHKIEKGLSLPNPRVGFGREAILYLVDSLEQYVKKYDWDYVSSISLNTLFLYYEFNLKNNNKLTDLYTRLETLKNTQPDESVTKDGGVLNVTRQQIVNAGSVDFNNFVLNRYSIRNFSPEEVTVDSVLEAVKIAQKTPSVCNRQSWKVHIFSDKEIQRKALSFQNGNAGFGDGASKILLVTANAEDFFGAGERHQAYIDGGMFSMSLIYALHSQGLGSCALNLALDYKIEKKIKNALEIEEKEILIMMIAVGHIPENLKVAASPRKSLSEIIKIY